MCFNERNCRCPDANFNPICDVSTGRSYVSACVAGCTAARKVNNVKKKNVTIDGRCKEKRCILTSTCLLIDLLDESLHWLYVSGQHDECHPDGCDGGQERDPTHGVQTAAGAVWGGVLQLHTLRGGDVPGQTLSRHSHIRSCHDAVSVGRWKYLTFFRSHDLTFSVIHIETQCHPFVCVSFTVLSRYVKSLFGPTRKSSPWAIFPTVD